MISSANWSRCRTEHREFTRPFLARPQRVPALRQDRGYLPAVFWLACAPGDGLGPARHTAAFLAVLWLPVLVIPLAVRIAPGLASTLDTIDYLVWVVFTCEYLVKLYLAPARWRFVRHHLIDLLVIAVPVLRPLRPLRADLHRRPDRIEALLTASQADREPNATALLTSKL
jgi:hypothetical protein